MQLEGKMNPVKQLEAHLMKRWWQVAWWPTTSAMAISRPQAEKGQRCGSAAARVVASSEVPLAPGSLGRL